MTGKPKVLIMPESKYTGSKVLLVEDEENLAIALEYNLAEEGYHVTWATDGRKALEQIESSSFDLILLDIMLPYVDGFEVAKQVREKFPRMPILMLTARSSAKDRIQGLEIGADDYLTKPFHVKELLLRVEGMLRRKNWYNETAENKAVFHFGDNKINFENLVCQAGEESIRLTMYEAMLLKYLVEKRGKVVSRKELLENVWNVNPQIETRTVDNFVARLRKYFEPDPEKPVYIRSVRGIGYIFEG